MGRIAQRNKRASAMRKLKVPTAVELRYQGALRGAMGRLHASALEWLKPKLHLVAKKDGARFDSTLAEDFSSEVDDLVPALVASVRPSFDQLTLGVARNNARGLRSLGLDVREELGPVVEHLRTWNISLMRSAADDFASQVGSVLRDPSSWGLRVEELAALIQERADVSASRATLIARDQTQKMNGQINAFRQTAAGVSEFVWSTSLDERVRESHSSKEGQTFRWDSPPSDTGQPGDDINCRCVGIPVLPDDEAEPAPPPDEPEPTEPPAPEPEPLASVLSQLPLELPNLAPAAAEVAPAESVLEEGTHVEDINVRRGVDQELVDHMLSTQPAPVLDLLAQTKAQGSKLDTLDFMKSTNLRKNPPGMWTREGAGTDLSKHVRKIQINTQIQPLSRLQRDYQVSSKSAFRAAEVHGPIVRGSETFAQNEAAKLAKSQGTLTHEIGHQMHQPPSTLRRGRTVIGLRYENEALDRPINDLIGKTYSAAIRDGTAKQISVYATVSKEEFFAESFAAYFHEPQLLDAKARDMVENVVRIRKTGKP